MNFRALHRHAAILFPSRLLQNLPRETVALKMDEDWEPWDKAMSIRDFLSSGEQARLIPVAADASKEVRAASILLATLMSVPPFARVMLGSLGQRTGTRASIDCYTEIVFKDGVDAAKARPDGWFSMVDVAVRGVASWKPRSAERNWMPIKLAGISRWPKAARSMPS